MSEDIVTFARAASSSVSHARHDWLSQCIVSSEPMSIQMPDNCFKRLASTPSFSSQPQMQFHLNAIFKLARFTKLGKLAPLDPQYPIFKYLTLGRSLACTALLRQIRYMVGNLLRCICTGNHWLGSTQPVLMSVACATNVEHNTHETHIEPFEHVHGDRGTQAHAHAVLFGIACNMQHAACTPRVSH